MQIALNNINNQRITFLNKCIDARISSTKLTNIDATDFINSLNDFIRIIRPTDDYEDFIKLNLDKFKLLKRILIGQDKEFYDNSLNITLKNNFRTLYNRIIIPMKYNEITDFRIVTKVFTNFVKGITYFQIEEQTYRWPIYHRNVSCGTNALTTEYKFKKTMFGPKKDKLVERCFIERTIYNILYKKILDSQNLGHLVEYSNITRIYQNYFPNVYIQIEIQYLTNTYYPIRIIINKLDVISTVIIETQIYTKTCNPITFVYDDIIRYEKEDINHNYAKTQTFDNEEAWQLIP
jgi:hypothetical protein